MYIALRLLRDGAETTITTRFPRDAVRRFVTLPDNNDRMCRLRVVGIDLLDPTQVVGQTADLASHRALVRAAARRDPDYTGLAARRTTRRRGLS